MTTDTNILASNCALVVFKVSRWTARRQDRTATAKVLLESNASASAGTFHKQLIAKDALNAIDTIVNEARTYHYAETLPWLDDGPRVLPAVRFEAYMAKMDKLEGQFRDAVNAFVDAYPDYMRDAEAMLGKLFKASDYPSVYRVADMFGWECVPMPMPVAGDFRSNIPASALAKAKADIEKRMNDAMALAVRDVFERVHDRVSAMVEKLTAYKPANGEHKATGIFRDSLVENMRELVMALPALNVTGDARISALSDALKSLCEWDAESLRVSESLRSQTAIKANAILQDVSDMLA